MVVIALGLALAIVSSYLTSLGTRAGWYAYAPLTGQVFSPSGFGEPGWLRVIIWLVAISLWQPPLRQCCVNLLIIPCRSDRLLHGGVSIQVQAQGQAMHAEAMDQTAGLRAAAWTAVWDGDGPDQKCAVARP